MSKNNIIIELTKEVAVELVEREYKSIDYNHTPFEEFILKFPASMFFNKQQMLLDTVKSVGRQLDPIKDYKAFKFIDDYINSNISLYIKIKEQGLNVKVIDSVNTQLFKFDLSSIMPLPLVEINKFSKEPTVTAMHITRIIGNVLDYISSPTVKIRVTETREEKKPKKADKKKKNKGQKTYIYKATYHVDHISDEYKPKRDYERHAESWKVRGHWRNYKSGKKVWIPEQTRGLGKEVDKEYRISRFDK